VGVPVVGEISLFSGRSFHFHDNDGLVVECLDAFRVPRDSREDHICQFFGSTMRIGSPDFLPSMASEHTPLGAGCIKNSIAEEEEHISRTSAKVQFIVGGVGEQTNRQTSSLNLFQPAIMTVNWTRQA